MVMQQMQQQMAMNSQQMWQGQQQQPSNQWNNNSGGGLKKKKKKGVWNGGSNQSSWNGNANKNTRWSRGNFPPNVRSDNIAWYCWSHRHDKSHNSGECKGKLMGHQDSARSHLGTSGNPLCAERTVFPAHMGLISLSKHRTMRSGGPPALPA